jgi:insulysin
LPPSNLLIPKNFDIKTADPEHSSNPVLIQ